MPLTEQDKSKLRLALVKLKPIVEELGKAEFPDLMKSYNLLQKAVDEGQNIAEAAQEVHDKLKAIDNLKEKYCDSKFSGNGQEYDHILCMKEQGAYYTYDKALKAFQYNGIEANSFLSTYIRNKIRKVSEQIKNIMAHWLDVRK